MVENFYNFILLIKIRSINTIIFKKVFRDTFLTCASSHIFFTFFAKITP